jgi:hypothetical protein
MSNLQPPPTGSRPLRVDDQRNGGSRSGSLKATWTGRRTVLAHLEAPLLQGGSVNLIFVRNPWYHIEHRGQYAARLLKVLRPGGQPVIVDFLEAQPGKGKWSPLP